MNRQMRWQDWITAALGVVLFITPFVFGDTSQATASWTAWVGGALLFVFGGGMLLAPGQRNLEFLPLILGVLLFLAPWVLGFTAVSALAWSAWIAGVVAFLSAGSALTISGITGRSAMAQ